MYIRATFPYQCRKSLFFDPSDGLAHWETSSLLRVMSSARPSGSRRRNLIELLVHDRRVAVAVVVLEDAEGFFNDFLYRTPGLWGRQDRNSSFAIGKVCIEQWVWLAVTSWSCQHQTWFDVVFTCSGALGHDGLRFRCNLGFQIWDVPSQGRQSNNLFVRSLPVRWLLMIEVTCGPTAMMTPLLWYGGGRIMNHLIATSWCQITKPPSLNVIHIINHYDEPVQIHCMLLLIIVICLGNLHDEAFSHQNRRNLFTPWFYRRSFSITSSEVDS